MPLKLMLIEQNALRSARSIKTWEHLEDRSAFNTISHADTCSQPFVSSFVMVSRSHG